MRLLLKMVFALALLSPATGQELDTERPWEVSVTGQIEALRDGDGAAALALAGAGFRAAYMDPQDFIADIERSGYKPIGASRTHTFGTYRELASGMVVVSVELIGTDGQVWEAIYQVADEPEGWRVQGVVLRSTPGIAI
ncbi:DUF4864 domain-containing protein [Devosia sediminis]|uniref:DUF4864 domain-containing protein n=1 Tax=Devosia sediminis TaxID=2798801 RepID=A0A934IMQ2_9HYPH|nr:DUF4864 domain-containing protein [Devosia sediminis]MBJ3783518.1 DUF4864 domain-containing protein [Devosia sediminis]